MAHDEHDEHILFQNHTITLSWIGRIRVLFGRPIHLNVRTPTAQNVETSGPAVSRAWVEPICHRGPETTCEIGSDGLLEELADLKKEARLGAIARTALLGALAGGMLGQQFIHWVWGGWIAASIGALFGGWIGSRS